MIPIKIPVGFFFSAALLHKEPTYKNSEESCERKLIDE